MNLIQREAWDISLLGLLYSMPIPFLPSFAARRLPRLSLPHPNPSYLPSSPAPSLPLILVTTLWRPNARFLLVPGPQHWITLLAKPSEGRIRRSVIFFRPLSFLVKREEGDVERLPERVLQLGWRENFYLWFSRILSFIAVDVIHLDFQGIGKFECKRLLEKCTLDGGRLHVNEGWHM